MQTVQRLDQPLRFYQLRLQKDLLGGWILVRKSVFQGNKRTGKAQLFQDQKRGRAGHVLTTRHAGQTRLSYCV